LKTYRDIFETAFTSVIEDFNSTINVNKKLIFHLYSSWHYHFSIVEYIIYLHVNVVKSANLTYFEVQMSHSEVMEPFESLSIASFGSSTLPQPKSLYRPQNHQVFDTDDNIKQFYQTKITNYIDDIDGATRKNKYERFYNKTLPNIQAENSLNFVSPTKRLLHNRRQIRDIMNIDDIDGTRMKVVKGIVTTKRHVNPLEPVYDLPKYIEPEAIPTKFLRDTLDIKDIKGCAPKSFEINQPRDSYGVENIEGTRSTIKLVMTTAVLLIISLLTNS
jgi:hypothetical protein